MRPAHTAASAVVLLHRLSMGPHAEDTVHVHLGGRADLGSSSAPSVVGGGRGADVRYVNGKHRAHAMKDQLVTSTVVTLVTRVVHLRPCDGQGYRPCGASSSAARSCRLSPPWERIDGTRGHVGGSQYLRGEWSFSCLACATRRRAPSAAQRYVPRGSPRPSRTPRPSQAPQRRTAPQPDAWPRACPP